MTMPIPDGSVIITPREMFDKIGDLTDAVRELKGAVDPALRELRDDVVQNTTRIVVVETAQDAHGNRLTALETKLRVAWACLGLLIIALGVALPLLRK